MRHQQQRERAAHIRGRGLSSYSPSKFQRISYYIYALFRSLPTSYLYFSWKSNGYGLNVKFLLLLHNAFLSIIKINCNYIIFIFLKYKIKRVALLIHFLSIQYSTFRFRAVCVLFFYFKPRSCYGWMPTC